LLHTLDLLESRALFDAPQRSVHVRIAQHAGHIYLDLADERWRALEVGPDGWQVVGAPPVRFRRPAGMLPIPAPERGGSVEALASFLNLSSRNDFVLNVPRRAQAGLRPPQATALRLCSARWQGSAELDSPDRK
jgi:hypothetical protein